MKIPIETITEDLRKVYQKIGAPPTKIDYLKYGEYGVNTVKRRFAGSWNEAILHAIGRTRIAIRQKPKIHLCKNCGKQVKKQPSRIKKNVFCNQSCSASYNNSHKKYGTRVSKLERWLQTQLLFEYPEIEFVFNDKQIINSELDIYLPSLKLAFELNGIFHYEPIFGADKLSKIQNNDGRKFQACLERGIELCIIDTSRLKYFKIQQAEPYLKIIKRIIKRKMVGPVGLEPTTQ